MHATSRSSSQRPVSTTSTRPTPRRTRWSVIEGELSPPYVVHLRRGLVDGLVHSFGRVEGGNAWDACCRIQLAGITRVDAEAPTCLACAICRGCHACRPGHIRPETMALGKWVTRDRRSLYPFEMGATHLGNAIRKLERDEDAFHKNWREWVKVLRAEAALRGVIP